VRGGANLQKAVPGVVASAGAAEADGIATVEAEEVGGDLTAGPNTIGAGVEEAGALGGEGIQPADVVVATHDVADLAAARGGKFGGLMLVPEVCLTGCGGGARCAGR